MTFLASAPAFANRPLGSGELLWWRMSQAASNTGVVIAQIDGSIDPFRLQQAIRHVSYIFPMLRAQVIEQSPPSFHFPQVVDIPLIRIKRESDQHWHSVAEQQVNQPINQTAKPLCHFVLVHGHHTSELLFSFNHSLMDGLSVDTMISEILHCYSGSPTYLQPRAPLPPYDKLLEDGSLWHSIRHNLKTIGKLLRPQAVAQFSVPTLAPSQKTQTRFQEHWLDAALTQKLVSACKTKQSSMHGLLSSALLLTAAEFINDSDSKPILLSTAISVLPKLKQPCHQEVGYFASAIDGMFQVTPAADIWQISQLVNQDFKQKLSREHIAFGLWLRRLIMSLKKQPQQLLEIINKNSRNSVHFTNMGRVNYQQQYGELTLQRFINLPSLNYLDKPLICLATTTFAGRVQLTFSYNVPALQPALIETFIQRYLANLNTALPEKVTPTLKLDEIST